MPTAGFWARYAAWSLDAACLLPPVMLLCASRVGHALADARAAGRAMAAEAPRLLGDVLATMQAPPDMARQLLADPAMAAAAERLQSALGAILLTPLLVYALLALPWSVLFEQSRWQATPGKRALGLRVADQRGRRLKAGHALLRYLASGLSWLTLNIGHAMAALPPRQLALHDRISDTRVLRGAGSGRLPAWAKGWIALQLLAVLFASAWAFAWLHAAMQAALQQALGPL
ncbi:MAG TPA: RDD family protein [Thermomonas sp.]|nr:RDD family protein [Thermomonas sp.]